MKTASRTFTTIGQDDLARAEWCAPDRYRDLRASFSAPNSIVQGAGLSYASASFADHSRTVSMRHFDRIIAAELPQDQDWGSVTVEAGITLGKLYSFLISRGYVPSVCAGHPQLSVGGLIASDAHGKNQFREGNFCSLIEEMKLFHPDHGELLLSPASNPEVFELTCGGFGLTGAILSAKIKVGRIPAQCVEQEKQKLVGLEEAYKLLQENWQRADFMTSTHDFGRTADIPGTTVLARFHRGDGRKETAEFEYPKLNPNIEPGNNSFVFNLLSRFRGRSSPANSMDNSDPIAPLRDYLFSPHTDWSYFALHKDKIIVQHQVLIPANAVDRYLNDLRTLVQQGEYDISRTVLQIFRGNHKLLRFEGDGLSISFDVPRTPKSEDLLKKIDALNVAMGARTNLIKDNRIDQKTVKAQYADYEEFRERLHTFDPNRRFKSKLSERLGL